MPWSHQNTCCRSRLFLASYLCYAFQVPLQVLLSKVINCSDYCAACYVNLDLKIYLDVVNGFAGFRFAETWEVLLNSDPKLSPDERWQLRIVIDTDHPREQIASYIRICMNCLIENHERTAMAHGDPMHMTLFWIGILLWISDRAEYPPLPPLHVASRHELSRLANNSDPRLCINTINSTPSVRSKL
jgi:hypothetical protein